MPGYGYAKVSKMRKFQISDLVHCYMDSSPPGVVKLVCILIDSRRGISADDRNLFHYLDNAKFPYMVKFYLYAFGKTLRFS